MAGSNMQKSEVLANVEIATTTYEDTERLHALERIKEWCDERILRLADVGARRQYNNED